MFAIPVLHQFGHIPALGRSERGHAPIVEDQDIDAGEPREQPCVGAIGTGQGVVTSTATDLTVPGAFGPSLNNGPDGTSRFSFFKRPDNATGGTDVGTLT